MAADTAAKRYSAINIAAPWRGLNVVPDASIPQGERQAAMFMYSGILAGAAQAVVVTPGVVAGRPRRRPLLYRVRVRGKAFVFDDVDSLVAFLEREELREERRAEARAERHAGRIAKVGDAAAVRQEPPIVHISSAVPEVVDYIAQLQAKIDRIYWARLGELLGAELDEEEELVILAAMLRD